MPVEFSPDVFPDVLGQCCRLFNRQAIGIAAVMVNIIDKRNRKTFAER